MFRARFQQHLNDPPESEGFSEGLVSAASYSPEPPLAPSTRPRRRRAKEIPPSTTSENSTPPKVVKKRPRTSTKAKLKTKQPVEDLHESVETIIARGTTPGTSSSPPLPAMDSPSSTPPTPRSPVDSLPSPPPPTADFRGTIDGRRASLASEASKTPRTPHLTPREQLDLLLDIDRCGELPPSTEEVADVVDVGSTDIDPEADGIETSRSVKVVPDEVALDMVRKSIDMTPAAMPPMTSIEVQGASDNEGETSLPATPRASFLTVPSDGPPSSLHSSLDLTDRDDINSRLSFIMKERLHHFALDIKRRTSQVMEDIMQDDIESDNETSRTAPAPDTQGQENQEATLMSLIGLDENASAKPDTTVKKFWLIPEDIDPFSKKYLLWLSVVVLAFFYNAFGIPLRCAYPYQTDENIFWWMLFDYICDFIYIVDMVAVKPRLIFMRGGITVRDRKETLRHYIVSPMLKLDIVSLLPTDLLYLVTEGHLAAFRVNRLSKLYTFWEFFDLLDSSFSNPYAIRITRTFAYMIYLIHCNSCVYYVLSAWQAFGQLAYRYRDQWYLNKWVYNNQGNAYLRCMYFTAAVATSTGNNPPPTNVVEYAYMTFSWMMGVFVFALLLGQIRDIVYNANKNAEEFRTTMDKALGECKRLELPESVTEKVRAWFQYTWEQQKTLDEKKLVDKLPLKLQTDLALSVHYNTLSKVQLFQDCDRALLRDLVLKLRAVIFLPMEIVCNKGDVGKEMYIVNQGILEVVSEDHKIVFATMKVGTVFGEISLLAIGGNNRRTASIRSKGYSTLFVLSKADLNDVIKDYPDAQVMLKKKAKQMLKKDDAKKPRSKKDLQKDLTKKCEVSTKLPTPRMLSTVRKLLPQNSVVAHDLSTVMDAPPARKLKRWSTIPDDISEASDVEFTKMSLGDERYKPTQSLDEATLVSAVSDKEDKT
uniref:Cyclic nucleotide-binding domain-containing protein n=2 Tax=Panagrellus redivivus TaxID=6233 RepID=A0A7E4V3G7_PANRE